MVFFILVFQTDRKHPLDRLDRHETDQAKIPYKTNKPLTGG